MASTNGTKRKPAAAKASRAKPVVAATAATTKAAPMVAPPAAAPPVSKAPVATPPASAAPAAPVPAESPAPILKDRHVNETIKNVAEKAQETTKAAVAKFGEQTKSAFEKGKQGVEDYSEFQKGNVEALAESARIAAKGIETMGQEAAAFAKKTFDQTSETLKAMAQVKSPTELMKLQADYFRTSFDAMVAQTSRSTEASLKLAGDIAKPLQNRLALAAEKVKVAA